MMIEAKYKYIVILAVIFLILLLTLCVSFVLKHLYNELPNNVTAYKNIPYIINGHHRQKLDLYIPESKQALPLIIYIHGGGWYRGDKNEPPVLPFLKYGYAVAAINYRLSHHEIFPAQLFDCKAAVRWLRANSNIYNLEPNMFIAWGMSAGGHLAALIGTTGDEIEFMGKLDRNIVSSRVQAVVDFYGPIDLLKLVKDKSKMMFSLDHVDTAISQLLGSSVMDNPEKASLANPISYISKGDPPFIIIHGNKDSKVLFSQSQLFFNALVNSGIKAKLLEVKGSAHGGIVYNSQEIYETIKSVLENIRSNNISCPHDTDIKNPRIKKKK